MYIDCNAENYSNFYPSFNVGRTSAGIQRRYGFKFLAIAVRVD